MRELPSRCLHLLCAKNKWALLSTSGRGGGGRGGRGGRGGLSGGTECAATLHSSPFPSFRLPGSRHDSTRLESIDPVPNDSGTCRVRQSQGHGAFGVLGPEIAFNASE
ncbi:hypothetical protein COCMIDRAFT_24555 [Bipolaris oryzae ATCC 44560]|uniref:Uncharacterized protein n=1 Tax=Bipolaris oryzae ATCC 44560 TaxID=930090 RepID=W6Z716_COCMI|nr:uncharacterized protein COCMIDRAFT_24555 [Bipolaris oryzae ATCC 44560]EUC47532.1 hypothetical protein COCMIDRAFT_24555 [Bipolaris oryzae ATCC 44560]